MEKINRIKKSLTLSTEMAESGILCLLTVLKFYDAFEPLESLRLISGTNKMGCTLLGLTQAARKVGFDSKGIKCDIDTLLGFDIPVILNIKQKNLQQKYIVYFGSITVNDEIKIICGDPNEGVIYLSTEELNAQWPTNICLFLEPTKNLSKIKDDDEHLLSDILFKDKLLMIIKASAVIIKLGITVSFIYFLLEKHSSFYPIFKINDLILLFISFPFLLIFREVSRVIFTKYALLESIAIGKKLNEDISRIIFRLPKFYLDVKPKSDFYFTYKRKIPQIIRAIFSLLGSGFESAIILILAIGFIAVLEPICLIYIIPFLFLGSFWAFKYGGRHLKLYIKMENCRDKAEDNFFNACHNIEDIKINCVENFQIFNLKKTDLSFNHSDSDFEKYNIDGVSICKYLSYILFIFSLLFNVFLLGKHSVSVVSFGILIYANFLLSFSLIVFFQIYLASKTLVHELRKFKSITVLADSENSGASIDRLDSIAIKGIEFSFNGSNRKFLTQLNFLVKKGECKAIMGSRDCGKTLLSKILTKQHACTADKIIINENIDLQSLSFLEWNRRVSVVNQLPVTYKSTVLENIFFEDASRDKENVAQYIQNSGLQPFINSLPQGGLTLVGDGGVEISYHQKQIISLARALYKRPELLILDDPYFVLDEMTLQIISNMLKNVRNELAIILLTNSMKVIELLAAEIYEPQIFSS